MVKELIVEKPDDNLRLCFQGSIQSESPNFLEEWYNEMKIWIKSIDPDANLNGQIIRMLEPCCKEKPKDPTNDKAPEIL